MMLTSAIEQVILAQANNLAHEPAGLPRHISADGVPSASHALVISGIRRCGKSTLLTQLLANEKQNSLYLNFEDPRLYDFERNDFTRLDEIIRNRQSRILFFDEIQTIPEWERYVRQKLDERHRVVVTGSNASLLGKELGTKLTGRHITQELFPFSFSEFCAFKKLQPTANAVGKYMRLGGFPEYVRQENEIILEQLFHDILTRDIAVRYGVRDVKTLQRLALYLISNTGRLASGNKLKAQFEINATSTILEYFSHLELSYLFHFVPKFSYSLKKQSINPRKVYSVDTGLTNAVSGSFSDDTGQQFENLIYLHLRRSGTDIYYYNEDRECDFVVFAKGKINRCIQVCHELNADNLDRETEGLFEAMAFFKLKTGTLVTLSQTDRITRDGRVISILPASEFLSTES